jgi:hypothetical protein
VSRRTPSALSDSERAERRRADRELARQAVERLRSSDGWQRWLAGRRHFHCYSLANQLLIARAMPGATRVAGFKTWLKLGYCVRKGRARRHPHLGADLAQPQAACRVGGRRD